MTDTFEGLGIDVADLLDADQARLDAKLRSFGRRFARRPNTKEWLDEFEKTVVDELYEIGFVAKVNMLEALLAVGPPLIELTGFVPGHEFNKYGLDHERKRAEVRLAKDRGEVFLGRSDGKTL